MFTTVYNKKLSDRIKHTYKEVEIRTLSGDVKKAFEVPFVSPIGGQKSWFLINRKDDTWEVYKEEDVSNPCSVQWQ